MWVKVLTAQNAPTYRRSWKTLQTSETTMTFLTSFSMISQITFISSWSLRSLKKRKIIFHLRGWIIGYIYIYISCDVELSNINNCVLTTSPLLPAEPGGPTGPLEPCRQVRIRSERDHLSPRQHHHRTRTKFTYSLSSPPGITWCTNRTWRTRKSLWSN